MTYPFEVTVTLGRVGSAIRPCAFTAFAYKAHALARLSYRGTPCSLGTWFITFLAMDKARAARRPVVEYRQMGRTGEKVSAIGMGTWRFGTHGSSEERTSQVASLRRGIALGMNLIDTAEIYATGRSEEVVGEAVKGLRDRVFLATKVAPENLRYDDVIRACRASLKRLGVSHVDLYQVHWPNPRIPIRDTMSAMERLVHDGLVRYVGVSNFSVKEMDDARAALGHSEVVSNQVEYSLQNRGVEAEILPYCIKEKVTLIAYSPLARGSIPSSISNSILERYSLTPAQAMLNWVTRNERVVAIPKAADIAHLEENAASVSVRFDQEEYELM